MCSFPFSTIPPHACLLPRPTRLVYLFWNVDPSDDELGTREGHRRHGTQFGCVLSPEGLSEAPKRYRGGQNAPQRKSVDLWGGGSMYPRSRRLLSTSPQTTACPATYKAPFPPHSPPADVRMACLCLRLSLCESSCICAPTVPAPPPPPVQELAPPRAIYSCPSTPHVYLLLRFNNPPFPSVSSLQANASPRAITSSSYGALLRPHRCAHDTTLSSTVCRMRFSSTSTLLFSISTHTNIRPRATNSPPSGASCARVIRSPKASTKALNSS
jgi:hypothetical protein